MSGFDLYGQAAKDIYDPALEGMKQIKEAAG
jgi:hypothetical protein